jgi:cytoskeletal protein CcmA (bactofilin family)
MTNFMGSNYVWWMGIVENRNDPLKVGRCQVRIFAWNDASKANLPTNQLLWSQPMLPLNSNNVKPPPEGTMVSGFFMDGNLAQHPIMTGWIPGIPDTAPADPSQGFCDPRTNTQLQSAPRPPQTVEYQTNGAGVKITEAPNANRNPSNLNQPMTNPLARNENLQGTAITQRNNSLVTGVPIATGTNNGNSQTWNEPKSPYATQYGYNAVEAGESGNVFERDDTFGAERIHMFHRSGTFFEMQTDGTYVQKSAKDHYDIALGSKYESTFGSKNVNIQGDKTEQIKGNHNTNLTGGRNTQINGSDNLTIQGNQTITISGDCTFIISGAATITAEETVINGPLIVNGIITTSTDVNVGGKLEVVNDIQSKTITYSTHTHHAPNGETLPPTTGS